MSTAEKPPLAPADWPDHTQLPDSDGEIVENLKELPQSVLLYDSILPILDAIHPDRHYVLASNSGIYWKFTDPPLRGCKAPDWFYVPGVPPIDRRRSYVLWKELVPPLIVLEFVSGDGSEERDTTPESGKFWVYERAIRAKYYGIFEDHLDLIEMYERVDGLYRRMTPNARGHFPIPELGVELGLWNESYYYMPAPFMRWYDNEGNLILLGHEIAEKKAIEGAREADRATREAERADRLAAQLRALGIDPEA